MKKRLVSLSLAVLLVLQLLSGIPIPAQAASAMRYSSALVDMLKDREGFSATPYWDVSHWSIGYGTTCPDDKVDYYKKNPMSVTEATTEFAKALTRFENAVSGYIDKHGLSLLQHEFDALVSFSYNCGEGWMSSLDGYFNTAVRERGTAQELIYGMCLYSTAGGQYILTDRRLMEANLFLNGVYNKVPDNYRCVFLDGNGGKLSYAVYGFDADLEMPVQAAFSQIPTGVDSSGRAFVYNLAGWYTAAGKKVNKLDSSVPSGEILYARWADQTGRIVSLPKGTKENVTVTVTSATVNVRKGPGTYYENVGTYEKGTSVSVTETYTELDYTWGKTAKGWFRLDYSNYADVKTDAAQFPKVGVCTTDQVNIRTGAGTSYNSVGKMAKNTWVTISQEQSDGSLRWGKISGGQWDGKWICLSYIRYGKQVAGVKLLQKPAQLHYVQSAESLKLEGSILQVTYTDGSIAARSLDRSMVTVYDNTALGETTVQAAYGDFSVSFQVNIIKPTVTFRDWDGTVMFRGQYATGQKLTPPTPYRMGDSTYYNVFVGWDRPVQPVKGNTTYTAQYLQSTSPDRLEVPTKITSGVYQAGNGVLKNVPAGTTVEALIGGIREYSHVAVYNGAGKCHGDMKVTTGMVVRLEHEGQRYQSLVVQVNGDTTSGWLSTDGSWYYFSGGKPLTGWRQIGGIWYYMNSDYTMETGWLTLGGATYFLNKDGAMVTGTHTVNGVSYTFDSQGVLQGTAPTGWQQRNNDWYYYKAGAKQTGWLQLGSTWYYLDRAGKMVTGRYVVDGVTYVFASSGAMTGTVAQETPVLNGWHQQQNGAWSYYKNDTKQTGWIQDGPWYYLGSTGVRQTGWLELGDKTYYLTAVGTMVTGEYTVDGVTYRFDKDGVLVGIVPKPSGWKQEDGLWYYYQDGQRQTDWLKVGNKWYYLNYNGAMMTGWLQLGSTWYYLNQDGEMVTGWLQLGNTWYYLNSSGAMVTGWLQLGSTWYYLNSSGAMVTGWVRQGSTWYYLNSGGAMVTGWLQLGNTWYYLNSSGVMTTGWQRVSGTWYYLNSSGAMVTGWLKDGRDWYYLDSGGAMLANTSRKIDGKVYRFNTSGVCTNP